MLKEKDKLIIFAIISTALFSFIYLIKSALVPFIFAIIAAYFLDPLADRFCNKYKMSRTRATSLILGLFLAIMIFASSLIFPVIYTQSIAFLEEFPKYYKAISIEIYPKTVGLLNKLGFQLEDDFSSLTQNKNITAQFSNLSRNIIDNILSSSNSAINLISLVFISPILVFYMLRDWDIMIKKINKYLPKKKSSLIRKLAKDIDKTLSEYVKGQFNVCLILGIIYAILLSFAGLNFGFLIGFFTGLFSVIPYIGMLCGVTIAIVIAIFQWGLDFSQLSIITLIFIVGQITESNFLTPKLIGDKIGLHPVWIIFGLFIFGNLFGFIGILLGVPLTAIFGVVIKHLALWYKKKYT